MSDTTTPAEREESASETLERIETARARRRAEEAGMLTVVRWGGTSAPPVRPETTADDLPGMPPW